MMILTGQPNFQDFNLYFSFESFSNACLLVLSHERHWDIKIGEENSYYFECCDKHSPKDIVYVYFLLT